MAKKPSGRKAAGAKAGPKKSTAKKAPPRAARPAQDTSTDVLGGAMKSLIAGAFLRRGG